MNEKNIIPKFITKKNIRKFYGWFIFIGLIIFDFIEIKLPPLDRELFLFTVAFFLITD